MVREQKTGVFRMMSFLMTFLLLCPSSPFPQQNINPADSIPKNLVGQAIFPEQQYEEWLDMQNDPQIATATKIKCTINTFFVCMYESVVTGVLQDFGFLFDRKDDVGSRYYSYELGLMYSRLEGWKLRGSLLKFYEYLPEFEELLIDGTDAAVKIWPRTGTVKTNYPYSVQSGFYGHYAFNLKKIGGLWLIQIAECDDEIHQIYPLDTDFILHVKEMRKRHEYEKNLKKPQKHKTKMPSSEELNDARKIEIFHEIFGLYRFSMDGKILLISFFAKDKYLYGHYENIREIPLFPVDNNFLEFQWRPESPYDTIYNLRFIRDRTGKVTKCLIQVEGRSYIGIKLKRPCCPNR